MCLTLATDSSGALPQGHASQVGVTPQIVRRIQPVLESIQYAEAWYAVFKVFEANRTRIH